MNAGAPVAALRDAIHIHPTLAEAVQGAALAAVETKRRERRGRARR